MRSLFVVDASVLGGGWFELEPGGRNCCAGGEGGGEVLLGGVRMKVGGEHWD